MVLEILAYEIRQVRKIEDIMIVNKNETYHCSWGI
jgi:hypothetical protein